MTLKEFLAQPNMTLTAVEFLDENTLINVVINDGQLYGLAVDTSWVMDNREVIRRTDFTLEGDILTVGEYVTDINELRMLSFGGF